MLYDLVWGPMDLEDELKELKSCSAINGQLQRLSRLKQLGLIAAEFTSSAYSKWEHHLGILFLANQSVISRDDLRFVKSLAVLHGIGHTPYGYPVERAVLESANESETIRREVTTLLLPVALMAEKHNSKFQAKEQLESLVQGVRYKTLYRWLSAYKILTLPRELKLGHREKLVHDLVTGEGTYRLCSRLKQIDYTLRDSKYTGLVSFSFPLHMLQTLIKDPKDKLWGILLELRAYLDRVVYRKESTTARELALTDIVRRHLTDGLIFIAELLEWTDEEFEDHMKSLKTPIGSLISGEYLSVARRAIIVHEKNERTLTQWRDWINGNWHDPTNAVLATCSFNTDDIPIVDVLLKDGELFDAHALGQALFNLSQISNLTYSDSKYGNHQRKLLEFHRYGDILLSFLLGKNVEVKPDNTFGAFVVAIWSASDSDKREIMKILLRFNSDLPAPPALMAKLALAWPGEMYINDQEQFVKIIPDVFSRPDLLDAVRQSAPRIIRGVAQRPRTKLYTPALEAEFIPYLYELLTGPPTSWVLPDVRIGDGEYQIDIVAIQLFSDSIVVKFIECTTSDSPEKLRRDTRKLTKMVNHLQQLDNVKVQIVTIGQAPGEISPEELLQQLLQIYSDYI